MSKEELAKKKKELLQHSIYIKYSCTNHVLNQRGLAGWTNEHKQAWELAQMDEMNQHE